MAKPAQADAPTSQPGAHKQQPKPFSLCLCRAARAGRALVKPPFYADRPEATRQPKRAAKPPATAFGPAPSQATARPAPMAGRMAKLRLAAGAPQRPFSQRLPTALPPAAHGICAVLPGTVSS